MASPRSFPQLLLFFLSITFVPFSSSSTSPISISPKTLSKSGDNARIRWSGIEDPSDLDWLGIYSPPNSSHSDFIGYVFLSTSASWRSGSGWIDLPLVNLRSNYAFRIFRWTRDEVDKTRLDQDKNPLPGTQHLLATSEELGFAAPRAAEQIHLSFTDREDEMRVMFIMGDAAESYVKYGMEEGSMDGMVVTKVTRYEQSDMCDYPANASVGWRDPGFTHDGVMKNLKKGRRYYYRVGSDTGGWSSTHSFMSRDSDLNETVAFLFGDMGAWAPYATFLRLQEESRSTVKWILRDLEALGDKPTFISHIGDISYARGYSWLWDEFFNQIESIAAQAPYHVCIGNHEYDWPQQPWRPSWSYRSYGTDGGGECGIPYSLRFNMPGNSALSTGTGAPDTRNLYYSFDAGVVHFLYMSTETNFLRGSDQYSFIKHDLESIDRKKTPFVVVQGHRPMYTTSNEVRDATLREKMIDHLEPLLVENNVTLALWGHVHRYERFCPLKNYSCIDTASGGFQSGTVHVVIGMGGQDWQPTWEPRPEHPDLPIFPQPERSMYRGGEFGYTRLVATREKLTLTYVGNHDGEAHDVLEILSGQAVEHDQQKVVLESISSLYVQGASVLLIGSVVGYVLGFLSRYKKERTPRSSWTLVKSEEV